MLSYFFLILASVTGEREHLRVALMCISLIMSKLEHFLLSEDPFHELLFCVFFYFCIKILVLFSSILKALYLLEILAL